MKSVIDLVYLFFYKSIVDTGQFVNNRTIFLTQRLVVFNIMGLVNSVPREGLASSPKMTIWYILKGWKDKWPQTI